MEFNLMDSSQLTCLPVGCQSSLSLPLSSVNRAREGGARRMNGGKSALQRSARQSIVSCSELEANCTARLADTLALSPAWSDSGSAVDAHRLVELQLPASTAPTVSRFVVYCGNCSLWFMTCRRTPLKKTNN